MIENPIIRGFNPDPSIIRVKDTYYIATSTFEWWPGVAVYSSKDLKNWRLDHYPLNRISQLNLQGVPDGGGIWAPCLSYDGNEAFLVYTNVKERGPFMTTDNYLVYTDDITSGKWSEPIYLNSLGFDPSLFHDDDGKKWLLNLDNHYAEGKRFNGLWLQEYDHNQKKLVGEVKQFYKEPHNELVEGTHIFKHDGKYYILKAQGGTGWRHSAQMSRSDNLMGPYEDDPQILLHSRDNDSLYIQKAGHADIVETPDGEIYMVHLGSRYNDSEDKTTYCGRETCIEKVYWNEDGWLRLSHGGNNPSRYIEEPSNTEEKAQERNLNFDFKTKMALDKELMALRGPIDDRLTFSGKGLTVAGSDGLLSKFKQSLIAHRIEERNMTAETKLEFEPECEKHMAGLIVMYDTGHWHYLYISCSNDTGKRTINTLTCNHHKLEYTHEQEVISDTSVTLKAYINESDLQFAYNDVSGEKKFGAVKDMRVVTDENVYLGFTGAVIGICVQDMYMREKEATFEYFNLENKNG